MVLSKTVKERTRWWLVFLAALAPVGLLTFNAVNQNLGADPAKEIVLELGIWSINFLWISLAITPIRKILSLHWIIKFRRMMGLFSLFYVCLHLLAFITFILGWRIDVLFEELTQRPYIIMGFVALLILIPLGVTSTKAMQKRLKKNWQKLHKLVYIAAILSLLHVIWQIRSDFTEALTYGLLLVCLFGYRLYKKNTKQNQ